MSTYTSEPGTRLAGRYRLVDQVNAGAGWTYWKATDETLARFVTVLTFAAGFPRVAEAVAAARAASRLNDPRFPQVFDVEDAEEPPYVGGSSQCGALVAPTGRQRSRAMGRCRTAGWWSRSRDAGRSRCRGRRISPFPR